MGIIDSGLKIGKSVAVTSGIMILTPVAVEVLAGILKPVTKVAIKGGITAYGIIKASTAGAVETLKDIAAEAKSELTDSME